MDNNILPGSENILRKQTVVKELYKMEVNPKVRDKKYIFRIMEFEREHSYLRGFELIKVVHSKKIDVGVVDNKIIAFKNLLLPTLIKDKNGKDWTKKLSSQKDKVVFKGKVDDTLSISFDEIQRLEKQHLIFRASLRADYSRVNKTEQEIEQTSSRKELLDSLKKISVASLAAAKILDPQKALAAYPCKLCINISLLFGKSGKREKLINIIHPREKLSYGAVNISQNIKKGQKSLSLKMEWTRSHNISFIGLAEEVTSTTTPKIKKETISLSSLKHSENKNITKKQLKAKKVELSPGQYVELEFPAKEKNLNSDEKVSFFLSSKGYYTPA